MEIRIKLGGWGRKGQHSAQEVNRNLEVQVQALTEALRKEKAETTELRKQLAEALSARVAKGRRLKEIQAVEPANVIEGGPVRFQLMEGMKGGSQRD